MATMKKPTVSILDPRFRYRDSAHTDVGATIRRAIQERKRAQLVEQGKLARLDVVRPLAKRRA